MAGPISDLSQFNSQRMELAGIQPVTDTLKQIPGAIGQVSRQQDVDALKAWQDQGVEGLVAAGRELGLDENTIRRIGAIDYNKGLEYVAKQAEAAKKNKYFETIGTELKGMGDAPEIKFNQSTGGVDPESYAAWMNWRNGYEGKINKGIVGSTNPVEQEVWKSKEVDFSKMTGPKDTRIAEANAAQRQFTNNLKAQNGINTAYRNSIADTGLKDKSGSIQNVQSTQETIGSAINALSKLNSTDLPLEAFNSVDNLLTAGSSTFGGKVLNAALNYMWGNKKYDPNMDANESKMKESWEKMRGGSPASIDALNRFRFAIMVTIMNHIKEMSGAAVSEGEAARYETLFAQGKGMDQVMSSMTEWSRTQTTLANAARKQALAQFRASTWMYGQTHPDVVAKFEEMLVPDNTTVAAYEAMNTQLLEMMKNAARGKDLKDKKVLDTVESMDENAGKGDQKTVPDDELSGLFENYK